MPKQQDLLNPNAMPAGDQPGKDNTTGTGQDNQEDQQDQQGTEQNQQGEQDTQSQGTGQEQQGQQTDQNNQALQQQLNNLQKDVQNIAADLQSSQTQGQSGQNAAAAEEAPDYSQQIAEIQQKVNQGDIDLSEAIAQASQISQNAALGQARQEFEQRLQESEQERTAQQMYDQFLQQNPDFTELDKQGELDRLVQENSMHDKFSAYWATKAQQLEQKVNDAYERGKQEGQSLAQADEQQRSVLGKPGSTARQGHEQETKRKPANEAEMVDNQLNVLERMRQQPQ